MEYIKKIAVLCMLSFILVSCGGDSYFEQITKNNNGIVRGANLNDSMEEIQKLEDKRALAREDNDYLEYEYELGNDDRYVVSYLFDVAGCYEIGLDTYFTESEQTQLVLEGFKKQLIEKIGEPTEVNKLCEWKGKDGAFSVELDYINLDRGMISVTAFANE